MTCLPIEMHHAHKPGAVTDEQVVDLPIGHEGRGVGGGRGATDQSVLV
jgi:hypothetical protein